MSFPVMVFAALVSLPLLGWGRAPEPVVSGNRLAFALADLDGSDVRLPGPPFDGNVVYVTLWGTWCPPCLSEIPTLIALQERHRDRGLIVVGIAFEPESEAAERRAKLRRFVEKKGINYLVADGGDVSEMKAALPMIENLRGLPVEILIDRSGVTKSSRNGYGYGRKWADRLEREILELLAAD